MFLVKCQLVNRNIDIVNSFKNTIILALLPSINEPTISILQLFVRMSLVIHQVTSKNTDITNKIFKIHKVL